MNISLFKKISNIYNKKNNLFDCVKLLKKSKFSKNEYISIINKKIIHLEDKEEDFFDERNYNKILCHETDKLRFYYIIWNINSLSKLHNHNNKKCLFKVLNGNINESKIDIEKTFEIIKNSYKQEEVSFINETEYHQMESIGDDYSITLHIYEK